MVKESIVSVDLADNGLHRSFLSRSIGEGDSNADRFGVSIFNHGEPVQLTNFSCVGYFIRPDGITLVIVGAVSENTAYVDLPDAAYAKDGAYSLTIKISGDGFSVSMRIVEGAVTVTTTGTINDPGSVVPDLSDLMDVIDQAEAAAETIAAYSITATQIEGTRYKIAFSLSS